jgi:hypothetical protein
MVALVAFRMDGGEYYVPAKSRYYMFSQTYCSTTPAMATTELDETVIVVATSPEEANQRMQQFVTFYNVDCNGCGSRWIPVDIHDGVTTLEGEVYRMKGQGIRIHVFDKDAKIGGPFSGWTHDPITGWGVYAIDKLIEVNLEEDAEYLRGFVKESLPVMDGPLPYYL